MSLDLVFVPPLILFAFRHCRLQPISDTAHHCHTPIAVAYLRLPLSTTDSTIPCFRVSPTPSLRLNRAMPRSSVREPHTPGRFGSPVISDPTPLSVVGRRRSRRGRNLADAVARRGRIQADIPTDLPYLCDCDSSDDDEEPISVVVRRSRRGCSHEEGCRRTCCVNTLSSTIKGKSSSSSYVSLLHVILTFFF